MNELRIGLLGFGTVGAGVVEGIQRNGALIEARTGCRMVIRKIADVDLERDRGVKVEKSLLTRDAASVVSDPAVDVVVELIGGTKIARDLVSLALQAGKPVVTANKALLAEHGAELFSLAARHKTALYFEASVGGGIPVLKALREGLVANRVECIYGILNGTCNYILTRMEEEKPPFEEVLKAAQQAGYAEAEPSLDVDGWDTAHKAVVLAGLAFGHAPAMHSVPVSGIRNIRSLDIAMAGEMGYRIKLLAVIRPVGDQVAVRVQPTLVPKSHMLASVSKVFNAVLVTGDMVGPSLYYGRGAGRQATASAVLADLADVACARAGGGRACGGGVWQTDGLPADEDAGSDMRAYLRLSLLDRPGSLAKVADMLGRHGISIASVLQREDRIGAQVPVILVTHRAKARSFKAALAEMDQLQVIGEPTVMLHIEDFEQGA